jgi:hypothetical protein
MPQTGAIPDQANDVSRYWQAIFDSMMDRAGAPDDGKGIRNYLPLIASMIADPQADPSVHGPAMALIQQITGDPRRVGGSPKFDGQTGVINNLLPEQIPKSLWTNRTRGEASDMPGFYKDNELRRSIPVAPSHVDEYRRLMQMMLGGFTAGDT